MFQFAHCPRTSLCVQLAVSRHHSGWVAPFGYIRLIAWMQLPLYVSPVSASFIGKQRQGIHLVLCVACCSHTPSHGRCHEKAITIGSLLGSRSSVLIWCNKMHSAKLKEYLFSWKSTHGAGTHIAHDATPTAGEWKPGRRLPFLHEPRSTRHAFLFDLGMDPLWGDR